MNQRQCPVRCDPNSKNSTYCLQ
ncbi:hypothetical protein EH207_15145 [Brenneria rubrifaciens]|uniref:Thrombomodulin-like EGF-like domain-containing protein n=1 Tax=Brenneria rubrifaciens TaxID=55213 RepID=A0A4V1FAA5_9GAMM|nr:hypothetical protein EH207_15145 [Brenneria rubrifaciens]